MAAILAPFREKQLMNEARASNRVAKTQREGTARTLNAWIQQHPEPGALLLIIIINTF